MLKILYVHGYLGHANGNASKLIKAELDKRNIECEVDAPPIPILNPKLAVDYIRAIDREYDVIVASEHSFDKTALASPNFGNTKDIR